VLLKRAVGERSTPGGAANGSALTAPASRPRVVSAMSVGAIACLSLWFFLWLGLLQSQELSRVFPFEGLNPALMVIAAWLFLKERIPAAAWVGVALICVGIALVSGS
jgi:uncharacterized membrane protein